MKLILFTFATLTLTACASKPPVAEVGDCIRKNNKEFRSKVYKVKNMEADGTPEVKDLVTGKMKPLLEYNPERYRIVDCPKG